MFANARCAPTPLRATIIIIIIIIIIIGVDALALRRLPETPK